MKQFVEVRTKEGKRLINLRWVEEICKNPDGSAKIYFAFGHNYTEVDESYNDLLSRIFLQRNLE